MVSPLKTEMPSAPLATQLKSVSHNGTIMKKQRTPTHAHDMEWQHTQPRMTTNTRINKTHLPKTKNLTHVPIHRLQLNPQGEGETSSCFFPTFGHCKANQQGVLSPLHWSRCKWGMRAHAPSTPIETQTTPTDTHLPYALSPS